MTLFWNFDIKTSMTELDVAHFDHPLINDREATLNEEGKDCFHDLVTCHPWHHSKHVETEGFTYY